jgi:hypothetical protein
MTLWILFCRMTEKVDMLFTFYAQDRVGFLFINPHIHFVRL